ncbi:hypothetical protein PTKIN_Ptkin12aG0196300 [Pterospermum kingtungense]
MNRASSTGFNNLPLLGGGPAPGFLPGRRRFHLSNPNAFGAFEGVIFCSYWFLTICVGRIERVPYTNRFHYVLCDKLAKMANEYVWHCFDNTVRTLPKSDPRVIRVESIARNLLEAMNKGLMLQQNLGASTGRKLLWKPATKHLNGKDWEVYVTYSECSHIDFDRKIVLSRGLIDNCKSDAELATVIAYQIGHYVARHFADLSMKAIVLFGFIFLPTALGEWSLSKIGTLLSDVFLFALALSFFEMRMIAEADYIGLMLMASAGYDPQVAPDFYEHLHSHSLETGAPAYYPAKKRAKLLKKPETMKLAKQIFEQVQANNGV